VPSQHWLAAALLFLTTVELTVLVCILLPAGTEEYCDILQVLARTGFAALCIVGIATYSFRERALLAIAAILAALLLQSPQGLGVFAAALDLAAFFGVFIAALTIMKEAATRSQSVTDVGLYLTNQPPGRRFYSVAIGGHILGAFLNFSAVSLISPLIQKGARAAPDENTRDLERRQLSALIRGFSWILLWAPTTLTQAVLLTLFTDVNYAELIALGLFSSVLMIVLGRLVDRFDWRHSRPVQRGTGLIFPRRAAWVLAMVCLALLGATYTLRWLSGFTVAQSLMFVAPAITVCWLLVQRSRHSAAPQTTRVTHLAYVSDVLRSAAPDLTRSAIALGLSGFIGRAAAHLLPADSIAAWLGPSNISGWLFLSSLPLLITLGGQIALSPIVFVVFLGQIITVMPVLPVDQTYIVFALSVGWALSMTSSPNATATLLIASTCNIAPTTLTWRWNARYGLLCYIVFSGLFFWLSRAS